MDSLERICSMVVMEYTSTEKTTVLRKIIGVKGRLRNTRIFCERARSSNESERSRANVKSLSETGRNDRSVV